MSIVRAHVRIYGRVQGVFYRANTRDQAQSRGINGWVKNLSDGSVEAVFEGEEDKVRGIIDWTHEGSPAAKVEDVKVEWEDPEGLNGFEIRH